MAILRRSYLTHVLIVCACSATDPSAGTTFIDGEPIPDRSLSCDSKETYCTEESAANASLANGEVWIAREESDCPDAARFTNSYGCNQLSLSAQAASVTFGDAGAVTPTLTAGPFAGGSTNGGGGFAYLPAGVAVTKDASSGYFAWIDPSSNLHVESLFDGGAPMTVAVPSGNNGIGPGLVGIAADPSAAIVAIGNPAFPPATTGSLDPTQNINGVINDGGSRLMRLDFADQDASTTLTTTFDTLGSSQLFTTDDTSVYWIGNGQLLRAPRDLSTVSSLGSVPAAPTDAGALCSSSDTNPTVTCATSMSVGLGASAGTAAGLTLQFTATCSNGGSNGGRTCTIQSPSCILWTPNGATPSVIYTTSQLCYGLAVDDAHYAYFALLERRQEPCNCPNPQTSTFTTAIVRVSLTDHTATTLPFTATRLYGPRAFLVDAQFLYGIDPAYVLRIDKKAFGP